MMRGSLRGIAARVERLADDARREGCSGVHTRVKVSQTWGDDPVPAWPEPDAPRICTCGQPMTYSHVVHRLLP
jgi:hypothetical protein